MGYTSLLDTINSNTSTNGNISTLIPTWLITSSKTWTCPADGIYRLVCIGKGGDGGYSTFVFNKGSTNRTQYSHVWPSTGGAGGGVAIADKELTSGTILTCNITDTETNINNTALKATAGADGIGGLYEMNGTNSVAYTQTYNARTPGTASGEWLTYGFEGNTDEGPVGDVESKCIYHTSMDTIVYASTTQYGGGNAGISLLTPVTNGNAGSGVFISQLKENATIGHITYGTINLDKDIPAAYSAYAGGGGAGGIVIIVASHGTVTTDYSYIKPSHGYGGIGAILIQRIG